MPRRERCSSRSSSGAIMSSISACSSAVRHGLPLSSSSNPSMNDCSGIYPSAPARSTNNACSDAGILSRLSSPPLRNKPGNDRAVMPRERRSPASEDDGSTPPKPLTISATGRAGNFGPTLLPRNWSSRSSIGSRAVSPVGTGEPRLGRRTRTSLPPASSPICRPPKRAPPTLAPVRYSTPGNKSDA